MKNPTLLKRDAVIIVVLVHIGIVLLWVSMGGCGTSSTREVDGTPTPADTAGEVLDTDTAYETDEPPVTVEEEAPPVIEEVIAAEEAVEAVNELRYVVQPGDSLWKISRMFGVPMKAIEERNDIRNPSLIRAGRELWIPNPTKGLDEATPTGTTASESAGVAEPTTGEEATPAEPVDPPTTETFTYELQPGDTIWKLARTYHTTTTILIELNGITDPKKLRAGDTILIPKPTVE